MIASTYKKITWVSPKKSSHYNHRLCHNLPLALKDSISLFPPFAWLILNSLLCSSATLDCRAFVHRPCDCTERARLRNLSSGVTFFSSVGP